MEDKITKTIQSGWLCRFKLSLIREGEELKNPYVNVWFSEHDLRTKGLECLIEEGEEMYKLFDSCQFESMRRFEQTIFDVL